MAFARLGGFGRGFGSLGHIIAAAQAATPVPVNTVAPAITGTAQEGQTLSVSDGTWTNSPTGFAYQWRADGVAISGAINSTRILTSAEVGKAITCTVTASNLGGSGTATSAATAAVIAAATPVPVNTIAPAVSGTATTGSTLTSTTGTWSNSPTGYTYQWRRDGVNISGATASTYVLVGGDVGTTITCRVTATNAGGSAFAVSNGVTLVAGATATNYAIAPTVQYHPHTAAFTFLGGASTFTGSFDGATNVLTLNSDAVGTFALGQNLTAVAARTEGMRIQSKVSGTLGQSGSKYLVGKVPPDAISNSPMSSDGSNIVMSMSDARGYAPLTGTVAGAFQPPRLLTDALGRKFLRFSYAGTAPGTTGGTFLQNIAEALNLDSHNMTWLFVGRVHNFKADAIVSLGLNGGTGASAPAGSTQAQLCVGSQAQTVDCNYVGSQRDFVARGFPAGSGIPTNANKMIAGTRMQLIGSSTSTTDGLGGTSTTCATRLFYNEQTANFAGTPYVSAGITRYKGITGFEVGRWSKVITQSYSLIDLYELSGWLNDELAAGTTGTTRTNTVTANAQAERDTMLANHGVAPITNSVALVTDSRGEYGSLTGDQVGMILTDPGGPNALPATTRVLANCYGGATNDTHWGNMLVSPYTCYNTQGMLGGGHDKAILLFGVNDMNSNWPSVSTAADTVARADEAYNGTSLDWSVTGYIDNGSGSSGLTLTLTTPSPNFQFTVSMNGAIGGVTWPIPIFSAGIATGTQAVSATSSISFGVNVTQKLGSAGSPVTFTSQYGTAYRMASTLLGRGWKVVTLAEIYGQSGSSGFGTGQSRFRDNIMGTNGRTGIQADMGNPSAHSVVDLAAISVGGAKVLGADANATYQTYFADSLHPLLAGRVVMVSGGDTPASGLKAAAQMPG